MCVLHMCAKVKYVYVGSMNIYSMKWDKKFCEIAFDMKTKLEHINVKPVLFMMLSKEVLSNVCLCV